MDWGRERDTWPNAALSRFVETRAHRWHVQTAGQGPGVLLLHGAGATTHSWRDLIPAVAEFAQVVAPDLPGHGFTADHARGRASLPRMAEDVAALLDAMTFAPRLIVGHSAGAAIALEMVRQGGAHPGHVLCLNGALMPFQGVAGIIFPPLAKLLSLNPLTAAFFARTASSAASVRSLIEGTGSRIDADGLALYRRAIADRAHVDGALRMMARWDLVPLVAALPAIETPVTFAIGLKDRAVPPAGTRRQAARMPHAEIVTYPDLGHLMHEERPGVFADLIRTCLGRTGDGD